MADRRNIIVPLIILGFIFLSPDPARAPQNRFPTGPTIDDVIAEEQRSLSELQNSTFAELGLGTDRYPLLNLTGFEKERGYAWDALPAVQGRVQENAKYAGFDGSGQVPEGLNEEGVGWVPLYQNVTGYAHGEWVKSRVEVQAPQLNMSAYAPPTPFGPAQRPIHGFLRNITGDGGGLRVRFRERDVEESWLVVDDGGLNVTEMEVEMTITDEVMMVDHEMRLPGLYFPELGQAVLTTTSDKFAGIFALPHLMLSNSMFEPARELLNKTIAAVIQRQIDRDTMSHNPWSPALATAPPPSLFSTPACELIVFLQQLSPVQSTAAYTSSVLQFLDNELRFPTGAFVPQAPKMRFSMVAFSPDCGYVLESKGPPDFVPQGGTHLTGPKLEALHKQSRHHILGFTVILGLQLLLLMRQMRESSTPSTRSRISFYTIGMLALGDGFTTMTFLLVSLFIGGLWINLVGTAFLAFISVSFFGMRFLMDIWTTQAPEREAVAREEAEQERQRGERFRQALQELRERQARERANTQAQAGNNNTGSTTGPPAANTEQPAALGQPTTQTTNTDTNANIVPPTNPTPQQQRPSTPQPPGALPGPPPPQPNAPTDTGATPIFMPSDQEGLIDPSPPPNTTLPTTNPTAVPTPPLNLPTFSALYTRFYLLLLASLFLSLNATAWPAPLQRAFFTALAFFYLSLWTPQIKRNVQRNCRKALSWEFVLGQSVLRLFPFAYFYAYADNVLFAAVDWVGLAVLAGWVWVQVVVLGSQEVVGPRWFVRSKWVPEAWDYHPVLREDEEGATLPIGFEESLSTPPSPVKERRRSSAASAQEREREREKDRGKRTFTCAICMQDLAVHIVGAGESAPSGPAGLLQRRQYMVTPCRHIFHSGCLEGWMKYRLVCPVCREGVPGL